MYLESTGLFRRIFLPIIIFLKSLLDDSFFALEEKRIIKQHVKFFEFRISYFIVMKDTCVYLS